MLGTCLVFEVKVYGMYAVLLCMQSYVVSMVMGSSLIFGLILGLYVDWGS